MAFSTGNTTNTIKDINAKVSEAELLSHYLGIGKIPCVINSPFRQDSNPSLGIYTRDGVRIYWTDFATKESGGTYDLLSKVWHCSFREVINKVSKDFNSIISDIKVNRSATYKNVVYSSNSILECKVREWRDYDIEYWSSYGVPIEFLKYAEVYPISHKVITKNGKRYVFGADKYAYAFIEHKEGRVTIKIYQPFNKKGYKWSNKHDKSVISLWTKIPEYGDKLVICSSLKDALCLWANTGVPAIATQGEGYTMSDTAINELKRRYNRVYILFDNDEAGLKDGQKLAEETGFTNLVLPQFEGGKDVSDAYKTLGIEKFIQMLRALLKSGSEASDSPNL